MSSKLLQLIIALKDEASAGLNSLRGNLDGLGGSATKLLSGGLLAATAAVGALGATSLSVASDFQSATATFASVAGGSLQAAGFSLDDVKNKALEMGAQTQFSAAAAQEAMINLAKGGVPIKDIMGDATQATLDLAAVGEVELASAADIVAKQLGVWGETGVTAADVSNTLAQAANASTVDVEELALGLANVGGVAKASGVDFRDLNQTMAMIAPGFSSASDAGTSLKTMILGLQPSTGPAIAAFEQFGLSSFNTTKALQMLKGTGFEPVKHDSLSLSNAIEAMGKSFGWTKKQLDDTLASMNTSVFYDQQGNFIGMEKAAGILQERLGGLSEAEQSAALKTMFGTDAFRAASIVVNQGAAGFQAMGAAMDAAGTAAEQAAIRNATFKFAWDSLLGTIETIQIVIGSALLPVLTDLVNNGIIPAANGVLTFIQALTSSGDPFGTFVQMLNSVVPGLGTFVSFLSDNLVPLLSGLGAIVLALVVPPFYAWATAAAASAVATMIAMAPITLTLLAIGAAVALLVAAWQSNWFGIRDVAASVWATIQPYLQQLVDWLQVAIPVAIAAAAQLWTGTLWPALQIVGAVITGQVIPALMMIATWLATNIPAAIAAAGAAFQSVGATVSSAVSIVVTVVQAAWNTVLFVTQAVWGAIASYIGPPLAAAAAAVSSAASAILAALSAAWAAVVAVSTSTWASVVAAVQGPISVVQGLISAAIAVVSSVWSAGTTAVQTQTASVFSQVQSIISIAIMAVQTVIRVGIAIVQAIMSGAWQVIVAAAQNDFGRIPAIISGVWDRVKAILSAGIAALKAIGAALAAAAVSIGKSIIDGVKSGISAGVGALTDAVKSAAKKALDAAKSLLGIKSPSSVMAAEVGVQIPAGIADGVKTGTPKAAAAMTDMASKLVGLVTNATGAFGQLANVGTIPQGAVQRFSDSMLTVVAMLDTINVATRGRMMASATQITGGANKVLETIVKGVEGFAKLATLGGVPTSAIQIFGDALLQVIISLDTINVQTRGPMMASATQITGGAQKIVDLLAKGAEAFTKLREMGTIPAGAVQMFAAALGTVIQAIQVIALQQTGSGIVLAQSFSESAAKIVSIVGVGVDALAKLRNVVAPTEASVLAFRAGIVLIVGYFVQTARWFASYPLEPAAQFADAASKIVALVGPGIEGLSKLAEFVTPTEDSVIAFRNGIILIVGHFVTAARWFASYPLEPATAFADAAGKIVGLIKNGIDGLSALATLGPVSEQSVANFAQAIFVTMQRFANVAAQFSTEVMTHAGTFADAAGKSVGILKTGVDGFAAVSTFAGVSQDAIDRFGAGVQMAVAAMAAMAAQFGVDAVAAASAFAAAAGASTDFLKKGVEGFLKLAELTELPQQGMQLFSQGIIALINTIIHLSGVLSTDALAQANQFANAIDTVITVVKRGLEALSKLGGDAAGIGQFTSALVTAVENVAAVLAQQITPASQSIGLNIAQGIAVGIQQGVPAIVNATYAAVQASIDAARVALGIASPSKVFDEIGQLSGAGLAGGLGAAQAPVAAAATQLANATIAPVVAAPVTTAAVSPRAIGGGGSSTSSSLTIEKGAITIIQQKGESDDALVQKIMAAIEKKYRDKL